MKAIDQFSLLLVFTMIAGCISQKTPACSYDVSSVEKAIKSGELRADFAERAKKTDNLYLREVTNPGIPYKVFTFSDYKSGYTVLAEDNHLVLLCDGFGGGIARDFMIKKENGKKVLYYRYSMGSGRTYWMSGRYVLGSGRAIWGALDKQ
jgi:hypothetical protein